MLLARMSSSLKWAAPAAAFGAGIASLFCRNWPDVADPMDGPVVFGVKTFWAACCDPKETVRESAHRRRFPSRIEQSVKVRSHPCFGGNIKQACRHNG